MEEFSNGSSRQLTQLISDSLDEIKQWRSQKLSLDGGFGMNSPATGRTHRDWIYSLSADFYPGERVHPTCPAFDRIELLCLDLAKELYHCSYADVHTLSSGSASMVLICSLTADGDAIMSLPAPLGHKSMRTDGFGQFIQRRYLDIPIDTDSLTIKMDEFRETALRERPRLIMLGSALYIFNEPFEEIRRIADEVGALVCVDVSHTYGLLPCSMAVNPLDHGADIIAGSTYKTVCGPNKGIICTNSREVYQAVHDNSTNLIFNYNAFLIPPLAQALIELREFGEDYGCQMMKNAKALGAAMEKEGFHMMGRDVGYTDTHLLAAKMKGSQPREAVKRLDMANVLCSTVPLSEDRFFLRPATLIPTKIGLKEQDMPAVAEILADALLRDRIPQAAAKVKEILDRPESKKVHFAMD